MLSRSVGLVLACALRADAFFNLNDLALDNSHRVLTGADPSLDNVGRSWFLRLPCADCNVKPASSRITRPQDWSDSPFNLLRTNPGPYEYLLNFTRTEDGKTLQLGGKTIYPAQSFLSSIFTSPLVTVHLIPSSAALDERNIKQLQVAPLRVTGSAVKTSVLSDQERGRPDIIKLDYQILSVEGRPADLDVVRVRLSYRPNGQIVVLSVDHTPRMTLEPGHANFLTHHRPDDREHENQHCEYLPGRLCRLAASYKSGRPCGGKGRHNSPYSRPRPGRPEQYKDMELGHYTNAWTGDDAERPSRHHHHHHPYHHAHGMTTHFDDWMAVFRFVVAAIASLMVGMVVGLFVAIVGALIGRGIGYLWFRHYRNDQYEDSFDGGDDDLEDGYDVKAPLLDEAIVVYPDEKKQPLDV